MATGKRYYWIKLRESFMTSDTVDFLMSQKDGANYVVLYQMLCLKTINTGGRLSRTIGEFMIPYDVEKIQRDCKWFSADTIRVAMNLYKGLGLIYEDRNGVLVLVDHDSMVGSETNWAAQKRNQRNELPEPQEGGQCPPECPQDVREIVHPDIRDKRLDIRDQSIDTETDTNTNDTEDISTSCPERSVDHSRQQPEEPAVFLLPLNDGTDYAVTQSEIDTYSQLYPAVDVAQEYRGMIGWLNANRANRKTRNGIKRFINNWLSKAQNQAQRKGGGSGAVTRGSAGESPRRLAGETIV